MFLRKDVDVRVRFAGISFALAILTGCSAGLRQDVLSTSAAASSRIRIGQSATPTFSTIFSFQNQSTGVMPRGAIALKNGNILGTMAFGGPVTVGRGQWTTGGMYVLRAGASGYTFAPHFIYRYHELGYLPGDPMVDGSGHVWAMTTKGVVEWTHSGSVWTPTLQYACSPQPDPPTVLTADSNGAIYGTCLGQTAVFKLTPNGSGGYQETTLYTDTSGIGFTGGLAVDAMGDVFGTTLSGGANGYGSVFEIPAGGQLTTLYSFSQIPGTPTGPNPRGVFLGPGGVIYGLTAFGGSGGGTVYTLTPSGSGYTFATIDSIQNGTFPGGTPYVDPNGNVYFTTSAGGGTIDRLVPNGSSYTEQLVHAFTTYPGGLNPSDVLVPDSAGNLYGSTWSGGTGCSGCGTVFKITP